MVFQDGTLVPNLTIRENLFLCHEIAFQKLGFLLARAMRDTARELLARVKVEVDAETPVAEVTPAVRQMVEIAPALMAVQALRTGKPHTDPRRAHHRAH